MSLAIIVWSDGYMQRFKDEDKAIVLEAYKLWKGRIEGADSEILRRVILPPSWKTGSYRSQPEPAIDTSHLTNEGVLQGMNEMLPRNDR